jgi:phosphate transport system protein
MERHFHQRLAALVEQLIKLSVAVEESVKQAVQALVTRDEGLVQEVLAEGKRIDAWEVPIEEECLALLATQGPVARDLRLIATVIKVNKDLERISDHAVNIAQRAAALSRMPVLKPLIDIPRMAELATGMVKESLDAMINRDVRQARRVAARDSQIDDLRDQIFRELLTYVHVGACDTVERAIHLILVSRDLERIGDLASDIAESVCYMVEARIVRHEKERWWTEEAAINPEPAS